MTDVYVCRHAQQRYARAPLFEERAAFLTYRLSIGIDRRAVRIMSTVLLHVIRVLALTEPRGVTSEEVFAGSRVWASDLEFHVQRKAGPNSGKVFARAAFLFLAHAGLLLPSQISPEPFKRELMQYVRMLEEQRGLKANTVENVRGNLRRFFQWLSPRRRTLGHVVAGDVLQYLHERSSLASEVYVEIIAGALRSFFRYGAEQSWLDPLIGDVLDERRANVPKQRLLQTPSWETIRFLINSANQGDASAFRAKAVMLLCAVYGLRASEVAALKLSHLDWQEQTISIRRSKSGVSQRMLLRPEVANAIRTYLTQVRPICLCSSVFVTLQRPYRPLRGANIGLIVRRRMVDLGICSSRLGPHTLRHACATQLLASGSSLRDIADFLGHRDLKSVSIYARCDEAALREIGAFSLGGIL